MSEQKAARWLDECPELADFFYEDFIVDVLARLKSGLVGGRGQSMQESTKHEGKEKPIARWLEAMGFKKISGSDLLSHPVPRAVPSALWGLTSVFGMGTGVSPTLWPPEIAP